MQVCNFSWPIRDHFNESVKPHQNHNCDRPNVTLSDSHCYSSLLIIGDQHLTYCIASRTGKSSVPCFMYHPSRKQYICAVMDISLYIQALFALEIITFQT